MASPAAAWLANDEDGDGTVSGAEMIDAYDKDHDGKLDAAELEDISRAYAGQIDYSNTLLNQIADMEQGQLKIQQEMMQDKTVELLECDFSKLPNRANDGWQRTKLFRQRLFLPGTPLADGVRGCAF